MTLSAIEYICPQVKGKTKACASGFKEQQRAILFVLRYPVTLLLILMTRFFLV